MFRFVRTSVAAALSALLSLPGHAQVTEANGEAEVSVKQSGDLTNARRLARDRAERDAIYGLIKVRVQANPAEPKVAAALDDMRKQLADNIRTTFTTEGDYLKARSRLNADLAQVLDLARSLGITSSTAMATARVLFLVDEFVGVGTKLDPSKPTSTEIDYSHDKSESSDRSSRARGARSQSAEAASASKESVAVAGNQRASSAVSQSSSSSDRDRGAVAVQGQRSVQLQDGQGASGSASRSFSGAASHDTSSQRANAQAASAQSASQFAGAASSENASASRSASASNFSQSQNDVAKRNDIVNLRVRQTFPDLGNARPQDESLIAASLQQVVARYGVNYVPERDFRVEGGRKLLISEIERLSKFDAYMAKASKSNFGAQYIVYGSGSIHLEGQSSSGGVSCSGQMKLESTNVSTGQGLVSATITKRASGSTDQDCRSNLAQAMAANMAEVVGAKISSEQQRIATQGSNFHVTLHSALRIPLKLRREFTAGLGKLTTSVAEGNTSDSTREWVVSAQGSFKDKLEELMEEMSAADPEMKGATMTSKGNRVFVCIEGRCPENL